MFNTSLLHRPVHILAYNKYKVVTIVAVDEANFSNYCRVKRFVGGALDMMYT